MVRRPVLRALAAAGAASLGLLGGLGPAGAVSSAPAPAADIPAAAPTPGRRATAAGSAASRAPLTVRIRNLTPSSLPVLEPAGPADLLQPGDPADTAEASRRAATPDVSKTRGPRIRITGSVTNRTDETWTGISLYAFVGDTPMRTAGELREAMTTPADAVVGDRITTAGTPGQVRTLRPGETKPYVVRVPVEAIDVTGAGVYWFGVHALGASPSNPETPVPVADGRARTFLPFVPRRFDRPLPTSLVLQLTHPVVFAADGSLTDPEGWLRTLSTGRLHDLLAFGALGRGRLTWVVDPALLDAVARLAADNPARSLGPTGGGQGPDGGGSPSPGQPSSGPTEGASDDSEPTGGVALVPAEGSEQQAAATPLQQAARAWLDDLGDALDGQEVLTLPWGNIDVPATVVHDPELLDLALAQRSTVLEGLGVDSTPVLTSPSGYLDADSIRAADPETRVLVTDRMFRRSAPTVADVEGHQVTVASDGVTQGTPGPSRSLGPVGLRQRILAEAAVRIVKRTPRPLVAVLPTTWTLDGGDRLFGGLDPAWLDLDTLDDLDDVTAPAPVDAEDLEYPPLQSARQLDATVYDAVSDLVAAGDTLQNLLTDNNAVGGEVTDEALTAIGYAVRRSEPGGRVSVAASRAWLEERLDGVHIRASRGVTLSGASGRFVVTLTNELDQPVTVSIRAESDDEIAVVSPTPVDLGPGSRTNVVLEATATGNQVHNVELLVTDADGTALGATDEIAVRSAQVSQVIWLIMGTGAGLLFLAIAVRLVRRIRAARRPAADPPGQPVGVA